MARSPLMLAASVTAAVPEAEVISAAHLTASGDGRNESAVATLRDGRAVVVRVPRDAEADAELATEAMALQALSDGVRSLLPFTAPQFLGTAPLGDSRAFITTFIPGYLIDAEHIPAGRGAAQSLGEALAAVHALPTSVVRSAGLQEGTVESIRDDVRRVVEDAAATGLVPVRLMVRWRDAVDDDALWRFEPGVTLGGISAGAFVYDERNDAPTVVGIVHWHGMQVNDPAIDLQFLLTAPEGADSVYDAYVASMHRAPDEGLRVRSRLHSELEFARWLLHGKQQHRDDIVEDAAALLDTLAEDVRDFDLRQAPTGASMDDAMAALRSVPTTAAVHVDTSMQTDTFDPEDLAYVTTSSGDTEAIDAELFAAGDEAAHRRAMAENDTAAIDEGFFAPDADEATGDSSDLREAQQAAENAIKRWAQES